MAPRYVVGIDSSTQSVKAIAWTMDGRAAAEGRASLEVLTPTPLEVEQDAESWWSAACAALGDLTRQIDATAIEGIAISTQRETMVFLDKAGRPMAPATLWMDRRARDITQEFAREFGADDLHRISGKPVDVIACVYRLAWYRRNQPQLLDAASRIADVQSFLVDRLTGNFVTSWTGADPSGIFDIEARQWSAPLLDRLHIRRDQLPEAVMPGTLVGRITADAAAATGLPMHIPVFAAGGDGQCAALGAGTLEQGSFYLNLGTALVGGLWSPTSELSSYWRTLISPTGTGYLLETVQKAGTYLIDWLLSNFSAGGLSPENFARLQDEITAIPVGSQGVLICPYLLGCMDPHWDAEANATITGLGSAHRLAHLYRAALEAMTLELVRALEQMRGRGLSVDRVMAIGGGAENAVWLQMIADAGDVEVVRGSSNQASSLGAAMSAAVGLGWFPDFQAASTEMIRQERRWTPNRTDRQQWQSLSARQSKIYLTLRT